MRRTESPHTAQRPPGMSSGAYERLAGLTGQMSKEGRMGTEQNVTVECQFGVGTGTPDLKVQVDFNDQIPELVERYPDAAGRVTGEVGRVEKALTEALERVREARARYDYRAWGPIDPERDQACLECNHPVTDKLSAVRHVGRGWTHLKCTAGFNRA